ncbi:MAG: hypothetical protein WA761_04835 [Thermoplasmata archaeon]
MDPGSAAALFELLLLVLISLPLGTFLLGLGERLIGHPLDLTLLERGLLAVYLAGGAFYVVASIPVPIYGWDLVVGLLVLGAIGTLVLSLRAGARPIRALRSVLSSRIALLAGAAFLLLLLFEVAVLVIDPLPNTYDGSVQVLFARLLLLHGYVPTTLAPFAPAGIIYPQGTAVWLSVPALVLGWPLARTPVLLTPLFLSLSVLGAFGWGQRLGGVRSERGARTGLVFALFFGAIATWPRFFVAGSYDFVFAAPLFLLMLGWLRPFVERAHRPWRDALAMGVGIGVVLSLSVTCAELLVALLLGYALVFRGPVVGSLARSIGRIAVAALVGSLFVIRSLAGIVVWAAYPGHVLTEMGRAPYAPVVPGLGFTLGNVLGQLDPFIPWDPKLSPVPFLDVEIAFLFVLGIVLLWGRVAPIHEKLPRVLPDSVSVPIVVGTLVSFLVTFLLLLVSVDSAFFGSVGNVSSLSETSVILFIFYQGIAVLPLVAAVEYWNSEGPPPVPAPVPVIEAGSSSPSRMIHRDSSGRVGLATPNLVIALAVVLPLIAGAAGTAVLGPPFVHTLTTELSNVTQGDLDGLQWAGDHLSACSTVLAAPGSAAQFLPAYATLHLVYPMNPAPDNGSYHSAVENLSDGVYSSSVRSDLLVLNVTEIFVTGGSTVLYPPLKIAPLLGSTDFTTLFHEDDAYIMGFAPGEAATNCPVS